VNSISLGAAILHLTSYTLQHFVSFHNFVTEKFLMTLPYRRIYVKNGVKWLAHFSSLPTHLKSQLQSAWRLIHTSRHTKKSEKLPQYDGVPCPRCCRIVFETYRVRVCGGFRPLISYIPEPLPQQCSCIYNIFEAHHHQIVTTIVRHH
jgi:hypothetical protein